LGFALSGFVLLCAVSTARADEMDLALSRLSQPGASCGRTLAGAPDFDLRSGGRQTLSPDQASFRKLMTQLAPVAMTPILAPVTTSGPRGFDLALQTAVTGISAGAGYWERGTEGRGPSAVDTCDGRNDNVSPVLTQSRVAFHKGLPLGITLGANLGHLWNTSLFTVGGSLKWALFEGYRSLALPDLAVRGAAATVVGDAQFSLTTVGVDAILSKNIVLGRVMKLSPYAGGGVTWIFAASELIDLTPNIDATACAAGTDPVCMAEGLSGNDLQDDIGHDQSFRELNLTRYRAFAGLELRYRLFAFAAEMAFDVLPPGDADSAAGANTPRQWTLNFAPSLSF
jgi:hypothetical protein